MYHILKSVGNLTIDTTSLSTESVIPPPPPPVSATGNLISNPSVEAATPSNSSLPLDWLSGKWGTNTPIFTYPVVGQDGARGMRVELTSYTSGDAKWYFKQVPVTPGETYTFSDYYQSNVPTNVTLAYQLTTGAFSYTSLGTPPAAAAWTPFTKTFVPPTNAVSASVFHLINRVGFLSTDNFSLSLP